MTVSDKAFQVKNDLVVGGNQLTLGSAPIAFNATTNKLQIYVSNEWRDIADSNDISFMDMGLSIDYNGQPTYIVQANGVSPDADSKFVDGGFPGTTSFSLTFDSGALVV